MVFIEGNLVRGEDRITANSRAKIILLEESVARQHRPLNSEQRPMSDISEIVRISSRFGHVLHPTTTAVHQATSLFFAPVLHCRFSSPVFGLFEIHLYRSYATTLRPQKHHLHDVESNPCSFRPSSFRRNPFPVTSRGVPGMNHKRPRLVHASSSGKSVHPRQVVWCAGTRVVVLSVFRSLALTPMDAPLPCTAELPTCGLQRRESAIAA